MKHLPNIEVVIVDCKNYGGAVLAIKKTLQQIKPGKVTFFTDIKISLEGIEVVNIPTIKSKREYSEFMMKELWKYLTFDYVLTIQADGNVLNGDSWEDDFLNYDMVGSPWIYDNEREVGNMGFALTTKKLREIVGQDDLIDVLHPEDQSICVLYKFYLEEKYGMKFAPVELAERFGFELREPICKTFGFHGYFHEPYKEAIVVRRWAALGDVVQVEPVLRYFHEKGYRVYLDCLPDFFFVFLQHDFRVEHFSNINPRMPYRLIDLDGSYEERPQQLHLKSYYEVAGIKDGKIKNAHLNFKVNTDNKLFKKAAVIHYDKRGQGGRNIYGIDWDRIATFLIQKGFDVIQVGQGEHEPIKGALEIKTCTLNLLQYVVASADLFIGGDSGVSHIAVAQGIPSVIFFGAVNSEYIHSDLSNICVIDNGDVCSTPKCWHLDISNTEGRRCYIDEAKPPCATFDTDKTIQKINDFVCQKSN